MAEVWSMKYKEIIYRNGMARAMKGGEIWIYVSCK